MRQKNESLVIAESLYDWLTTYLVLTKGYSEHTVRSYKESIRLYVLFLQDVCQIKPGSFNSDCFSADKIERWMLWLKESRGCSDTTRNLRLAGVKSFISYLAYKHIEFNAIKIQADGVKQIRNRNRNTEYIQRDTIQSIMEAPDVKSSIGRRDLAIISLLYGLGARIGEILSLTTGDLHLSGQSPYLIVRKGKGLKPRVAFLLPKLVQIIQSYISEFHREDTNPTSLLFYSKYHGKRNMLTEEAIGKRLKKYAKVAHLKDTSVPLNLHSHYFRHARATHWLEDGLNIVEIQKLLDHENLDTTMKYVGVSNTIMKQALEKNENMDEIKTIPKWKKAKNLVQFLGL